MIFLAGHQNRIIGAHFPGKEVLGGEDIVCEPSARQPRNIDYIVPAVNSQNIAIRSLCQGSVVVSPTGILKQDAVLTINQILGSENLNGIIGLLISAQDIADPILSIGTMEVAFLGKPGKDITGLIVPNNVTARYMSRPYSTLGLITVNVVSPATVFPYILRQKCAVIFKVIYL